MTGEMATAEGVRQAYEVVRKRLKMTPIMTSSSIDGMVGCEVLFKCEHLQKTGSFKARGALYNISTLSSSRNDIKGVITHSSGNHGQAVAWAAREAGIPCTVVVPRGAPSAKLDAMKGYNADVHSCGDRITDREEDCARLSLERGLTVVEPFNHPLTICGQGTLAEELKEQIGEVEALFVSVGGGGLASGIALSLPNTRLYLVEPEEKRLDSQLKGTHDGDVSALRTVADGIRVRKVGEENRRILNEHPNTTIISVSEEEIREALVTLWCRLKQHVEPTAAVAFAGLRQVAAEHHGALPFTQAVVVLCGGNVDHTFVP